MGVKKQTTVPLEGELTKQLITAWYRTNFRKGTMVAGLREGSSKTPVLWIILSEPRITISSSTGFKYEKITFQVVSFGKETKIGTRSMIITRASYLAYKKSLTFTHLDENQVSAKTKELEELNNDDDDQGREGDVP